jgi:hypothetical protein
MSHASWSPRCHMRLMRSKQSSELHGTWGFCLPTYRNTPSSQWRGWLGNRSRGTPSASTHQCNCGAGSYASQKHTVSGRPTQQMGEPCARGMHGRRWVLRSAARRPDPSTCVLLSKRRCIVGWRQKGSQHNSLANIHEKCPNPQLMVKNRTAPSPRKSCLTALKRT